MLTSSQIRQQFIDFFCQKHGHTFVPSSPVVPHDDPTLLFTNAGMNQFKPLFLGQEKRAYTRAANTQKCIRAGGKHNDLDDVGRSRRHQTFFEMLGNWSFGDYFKAEAIEWAWELLTKVWKLDPARLHVSCFEGDEKNGVPRDTEAADLWKKIAGLPDDHIHYFGKDNFWEMGDTGPCGPCTEIYIDRTPDKSGGPLVNGEDPRVMEIWNLVFIQYNRNADRSLTVLPSQHVDTGMGFERICQVLQNVEDNYSIDLWVPFFAKLTELSGKKFTGKLSKTNTPDAAAEAADPQLRTDIAFRVIADHIRCLTFAITDGAVPSNEGRGYVLRRILRRAVRFGRQQLELKQPFLHEMVNVVVDSMADAFPELKKNPKHVIELVKDEEISFGRTLEQGLVYFRYGLVDQIERLLQNATSKRWRDSVMSDTSPLFPGYSQQYGLETFDGAESANVHVFNGIAHLVVVEGGKAVLSPLGRVNIPGALAFKLHDTYGFPIDLTQQMAIERGMTVDIAGYEKLMDEAREKARAGGKGGDSPLFTLPPAAIAELQKNGAKPTNDSHKFKLEPVTAKVVGIWNGSELVQSADAGAEVAVILDRTNFYAEMGGQVGDRAQLASTSSNVAVETTRAVGGYVLHIGKVAIGTLHFADPVMATLAVSRNKTQQNHTATHLANWALREVLGAGVQQKGSLVDPEKLRFDFSHNAALKEDEVARVEALVGESIKESYPVYAEEAPQEDAIKINGLRAVFGEKYPPMVRVVSIGARPGDLLAKPDSDEWRKYSIEFCGGTHVANTSEVERFVVTGEESVSKGVRRIIALTGQRAHAATEVADQLAQEITRAKSLPESQLPGTINALQKQSGADNVPLLARRRAHATVAELQDKLKKWEKSQKATGGSIDVATVATDLLANAETIAGGKLIIAEIAGANSDQLRSLLDSIRKRQPSVAALVVANDGTKLSFVTAVSEDLIAKGLKAGDWVKEAAKLAGGGGGGSAQMGQAGGKDPAKLADALAAGRQFALKVLQFVPPPGTAGQGEGG